MTQTQPINLGVGHPASSLLPQAVIRQAAQHRLEQADTSLLQYGPDWGDLGLREQLSSFLGRQLGVDVPPDELMICAGISGGLDMVCAALAQPGQTAVCEDITYFAAPGIIRGRGLHVAAAPMDERGLEPLGLERTLQDTPAQLIYTIPSHHNPTGLTQDRERREQLTALARRSGAALVADEVYHLLDYSPAPPPPYSVYVPGGNIISLGTFSKILAPGLRVGWVHAPAGVLERLATEPTLQSAGGANPFGSGIVRSVLELGLLDEYLPQLRTAFAARAAAMIEALRAPAFEGCEFQPPTGGYFLWLRLPAGVTAAALAPHALRAGVTFKAGELFSVSGGAQDRVRLCFAFHSEDEIAEGVRRLGEALGYVRPA